MRNLTPYNPNERDQYWKVESEEDTLATHATCRVISSKFRWQQARVSTALDSNTSVRDVVSSRIDRTLVVAARI